jgi:membrane protein involved in colicin uptake
MMDRAGHSATLQSHLTVEHKLDEAQLDARIIAICAELGISESEAQKLLIDPSKIVDAEFSEVPRELTPKEIAAQAERDRENERRKELRRASPEERARLKREARERRSAEGKAKRAAAEAARAGTQTDIEDFLDDGSAGLEDLLGSDGGDDA